jgi:hypothetical protein
VAVPLTVVAAVAGAVVATVVAVAR